MTKQEAKQIQEELSAKYKPAAEAPCVCCGMLGACKMGDYVPATAAWSKEDSLAYSEAHYVIVGKVNLFA